MRLPDTPAGLAQIGGHEPVVCSDCGKGFDGDRNAARKARWEPNSYDSQHAIDHGPMTCPECVKALLEQLVDAMAEAGKAGKLHFPEGSADDEREDETL